MKDPLDLQVGGQHYKGMAIQPIELAFANRYDACIFSSFKYLMRHHEKDGAEGLAKGGHFCHMRWSLIRKYGQFPLALDVIPVLRMAFANKMPEPEQEIAVALHEWACGELQTPHDEVAAEIAAMFVRLSEQRYPKEGRPA